MGSPAYDRQHTKMILFKFNLKTDKDILDKLSAVGNKQAYIKRLIRADLKKSAPADIDAMITAAVAEEASAAEESSTPES